MISRLNLGLWYPLPTLHERRCRRPCKARFRLAGCAFTGRVSNPLDRDERFQVTSVLLSRTSPDASWVHLEYPRTGKGPRRQLSGMMLHQNGPRREWLADQDAMYLILTMDDR